jgi:hypothetical protein
MGDKSMRRLILIVTALVGSPAFGQGRLESADRQLLNSSEAEQVSMIRAALDRGFPQPEASRLSPLVYRRSSLILPVIEQKIEEVLRSSAPSTCFSDPSVNPQKFVDQMAWGISDTGDVPALVALSKLMKLDEKRFGPLVGGLLLASKDRSASHNPFLIAYAGLGIGDAALDQRIIRWLAAELEGKRSIDPLPDRPSSPFELSRLERWWADALVDRYGRIPTEREWADDPIASRLSRPLAEALHDPLSKAASEALQRRANKSLK